MVSDLFSTEEPRIPVSKMSSNYFISNLIMCFLFIRQCIIRNIVQHVYDIVNVALVILLHILLVDQIYHHLHYILIQWMAIYLAYD
jgi:hypothetical protein